MKASAALNADSTGGWKTTRPQQSTRRYRDEVIICGEPVYHDEHQDVVLNPTVIVEVLSPTTEAFDRGAKIIRLRSWNPSLQHYLLVAQDAPLMEVYQRTDEAHWSLQTFEGLTTTATLDAIDCRLPLAEVYDRVEFPPADAHGEEG